MVAPMPPVVLAVAEPPVAAYAAARLAAWAGDEAGVIAATQGLTGTSEEARRANLLRGAALLAQDDLPGAVRAFREVVHGGQRDDLSDAAYLEVAEASLSRGRLDDAVSYARFVGPGPAFGQALALRAHAELLDGEQGRGLGALIGAEGASPWFEPEAMAWASRSYAAICHDSEATAWARRLERLEAIRGLAAPWLERLDEARTIDPGFATWLLADPEVAAVVAEADQPGLREAAEALLARRQAEAVERLDAAVAIAGGKGELPVHLAGWLDDEHTVPVDERFNGEFWADEIDRYRFTGRSRCGK
jgi:hypothetical protein